MRELREWSPVLVVIGAVAVVTASANWSWLSGLLSASVSTVEVFALLGVVVLFPVAAIVAVLRWEPSPDRYYWIAIIVVAPTLGPLGFFLVSLIRGTARRAARRSHTPAIGFRPGSDGRRGPQASASRPAGF